METSEKGRLRGSMRRDTFYPKKGGGDFAGSLGNIERKA